MTLSQLVYLIKWDLRVNRGVSFDRLRATLLLIEVRLEQYVYRQVHSRPNSLTLALWYICRLLGSTLQWFLCNSNIPGSVTIGRGLRLPHPQNIVIAGSADIGEFSTIYHNVSIAWNGFKPTIPLSPRIGDRVLIGCGAIILGDVTIGTDVLIGAGAVVTRSVPDHSRVTSVRPDVSPRHPSSEAAEPGSERHLRDPYSIWR
jgi:serine acetyltransferase